MTVDSCNRPSGRRPDQMRDVSFELGFTKQAAGSVWRHLVIRVYFARPQLVRGCPGF